MSIDQYRHHDGRGSELKVEILVMSDPDPDTSYLEQPEFADRLAEYRADYFGFVGVRARVTRHDWASGVRTVVESAGCWGIETDSGDDYLRDVGNEELAQIADELAARNIDIAGIEPTLQESN